jgi:FG-GAP-like repeat
MATPQGPQNLPACKRRARGSRLATPASCLLFVPLIGLFCWQVTSSYVGPVRDSSSADVSHSFPRTQAELKSKALFLSKSLKPVANPRFGDSDSGTTKGYREGPLEAEMIAARGDPFVLAHLSGVREGILVTRARSGMVPTLGLPSLRTRTLVLSTNEIRRGLRNGLGGSFDRFFSEVLALAMSDMAEESGVQPAGEENPFTRALEALKESAPVESAEKVVEQKAPPPEKTTPAPESGENPLASLPAETIAAGLTIQRPYLILRVGEGNVFRSVAASQPREGTFESAEFGLTDFRVFPMTDAAEFPLAMAVADFNGDTYADLVVHVPQQRLLRFFYQNPDGDFQEGMRIDAGGAPLSLAASDFNRDGFVDLAFSHLGTGLLTVIYADANQTYRYFRTFASDVYRDYIIAADTSGTGNTELLAMNFANYATVLVDFAEPAGEIPGKRIEYAAALNTELARANARPSRVNAVLLNASLAINFDDRMGRLMNVLNVAAGANVYIIVGDLDNAGGLDVGLGIPRR